jgi:hypothetical protein
MLRILLDESVPKALGFLIEGHFVRRVQFAGFAGLQNGKLMAAMVNESYDCLITFDQNLPYQQSAVFPVVVIALVAPNNRVETQLRFAPLIKDALTQVALGQLIKLEL